MKLRLIYGCVAAITLATGVVAQTDDPSNNAFNPSQPNLGGVGAVLNSFALPAGTDNVPVGLENDGNGDLLGTTIGDSIFFTVDTSGALVSGPTPVPAAITPIGITTNGTSIFVTDTTGIMVQELDFAGNVISSFDVSNSGTFPEGITIASFDDNFYVVDGSGGNQVGQYSSAGTLLSTFPVNGTSQDGIAFDNTRCVFWVYDSGTDLVRSYDSSFTELENFPGTGAAGFANGEGVGVVGDSVFVLSTGSTTVVEFDISGAQSAANASTLCATGPTGPVIAVPTLSQSGLALLALVMMLGGAIAVRRFV